MHTSHTILMTVTALLVTESMMAAPPMPNEFETLGDELSPLFAYFGGVTAWGSSLSTQSIHSGGSLEVWADLQPDWAAFSGFAIGTYGISSPQLNIDPFADTFSLTIQAPANGQLSFYVAVREDDNGDGVIDVVNFDDEWETSSIMLDAGTQVYNFAFSDFIDVDPVIGNNVPNFNTTGRIAYFLIFESYDSYPGGHINEPVSFLVDHIGFYVGPQSLPNPQPADLTGDGIVNVTDLLMLLSGWGICAGCPADITGDGLVNVTDLLTLLSAWG